MRRNKQLGDYQAPEHLAQWLSKGAILYTSCDEDSWSELRALELQQDDVVLSITGSGCRTLNLLVDGPGKVVSVDANPLQSYLLELKLAGIRNFAYDKFAKFIGLHPSDDRVELYDAVRADLSDPARSFWDVNRHVVRDGVLYSGAHERFYEKYVGQLLRQLRPTKVRQFFQQTSLEDQVRFYDKKWDTLAWRIASFAASQPWIMKLLLGDPSYFAHVERKGSVGDYLNDSIRELLHNHLASESHLLALIFFGHYLNDDAVPPFLSPKYYDAVRAHADAVEVVTEPIDTFLLKTPESTFSKYSLSDITGWTKPAHFTRILGDVIRTAKPGGRFCYRNFLSDRQLPRELLDSVTVRDELAVKLRRDDLAFAFTFVVADVEKAAPAETPLT